MQGREALLHKLAGQGHLIGNHTETHPGLAELAARGGDVVAELAACDERLAEQAAERLAAVEPEVTGTRGEAEQLVGVGRAQPLEVDRQLR